MALSVFHGGFTRETAKEVTGSGLHDMVYLTDRSFVQIESSGRYTLHRLMRQYAAERLEQPLDPARITYVHLVRGALRVNDHPLRGGDAARIEGEPTLVLEGGQDAEVLVFDLAP